MVSSSKEERCGGNSRSLYMIVLLYQTIGPNLFIILPNRAIENGATGHIISYVITYVVIGIPLLYMEFTVAQFTGRDCIDVWKVRPCLSHIGYIHIMSQIIIIIYNHSLTAFSLHYFFISFEDPIPYYVCGPWSMKNCDIIAYNYTVNEDCIKVQKQASYCDKLFQTFPEYQYWKFYILGLGLDYFYIAWRICIASAIGCVFIFVNYFKRKQSIRWFSDVLVFYPIIGYLVLMTGSMLQKGLVVTYDKVLDTDVSLFLKKYRLASIVEQVVFVLNIGTGISFNLASSASFRSPCYSNVVITVVTCCAFTVLSVCSLAVMACPYTYEYGMQPFRVLKIPISVLFETVPRFLRFYKNRSVWLLLVFSCNAVVSVSANALLVSNLFETLRKRNKKINNYPGLVLFIISLILFCITIPILGNIGVSVLVEFKKYTNLIRLFMAMIECFVFVLWYGVEKFSEDVHFMQGIQPKCYMKLIWVLLIGLLGYVFFTEVYYLKISIKPTLGSSLGWWTVVVVLTGNIIAVIGKLIVAAYKKKFRELTHLDSTWGPRNELLLRSRAMFTAQAMTKEYLYRQYHLQAGIIARQNKSNIRNRSAS